ncbi:hypothetical protein HYS03_00215 [Candidatus Woesebacteria bacterium]|nr:hypothetical protein [Candidatus Woesebacteria bacterium]QQG47382.1 MAG: hypothetical protein HY044_04635 [Candidatus Woesebacteria bacterium]
MFKGNGRKADVDTVFQMLEFSFSQKPFEIVGGLAHINMKLMVNPTAEFGRLEFGHTERRSYPAILIRDNNPREFARKEAIQVYCEGGVWHAT